MTKRFRTHPLDAPAAEISSTSGLPVAAILDTMFANSGARRGLQEELPTAGIRRQMAPAGLRSLSLEPSSWNAEARTIEVVWTTGARCPILLPEIGFVEEELLVGPRNVRLARLNAGAPVLNCHNTHDVGGQIGVVVPGSAKLISGRGVATLKLSEREDAAPLVADIAAGIIRNVSVGYWRHVIEIDNSVSPPLCRTLDWEPTEISFVTVQADAGAHTRNAGELQPCVIRNAKSKGNGFMNTSWLTRFIGTRGGRGPVVQVDGDDDDAPVISATRQASVQFLRTMMANHSPGFGLDHNLCNELVIEMAERQLTEADAHAAMLHIVTENQRQATRGLSMGGRAIEGFNPSNLRTGNALIYGERSLDNPAFHASAVGDALYARMSGAAPTEAAREFMGMSLVELAGDMLERQGVRSRGMSSTEVIEAASWNRVGARAAYMSAGRRDIGPGLSTSDFPDLLQGAGERFLLDVFAAAASPLKQIARRRSAKDFRAITGIQLSGFGTLDKVLENGEIKHGSLAARTETYKLESFAKILTLTREAIINDDLGAFSSTTQFMARAAAETEAQILAALLIANPVMTDGHRLFDVAHKNYVDNSGDLAPAGNGAPTFEALDAARLMMRGQKDLDGVTPLATAPKFILSGPQRETAIEQLVSGIIAPTEIGGVNPFVGKLTPLVDPRLTGPSWYLFADPNLSPVLEYAYLSGNEGPKMDTREGWNTLGTEFRVYMDFGAGIIDQRGAYKNSGKVPA